MKNFLKQMILKASFALNEFARVFNIHEDQNPFDSHIDNQNDEPDPRTDYSRYFESEPGAAGPATNSSATTQRTSVPGDTDDQSRVRSSERHSTSRNSREHTGWTKYRGGIVGWLVFLIIAFAIYKGASAMLNTANDIDPEITQQLSPEEEAAFKRHFKDPKARNMAIKNCFERSRLRQFNASGKVLTKQELGSSLKITVGICQIDSRDWYKAGEDYGYDSDQWLRFGARKEGLDINELDGNVAFKAYLTQKNDGAEISNSSFFGSTFFIASMFFLLLMVGGIIAGFYLATRTDPNTTPQPQGAGANASQSVSGYQRFKKILGKEGVKRVIVAFAVMIGLNLLALFALQPTSYGKFVGRYPWLFMTLNLCIILWSIFANTKTPEGKFADKTILVFIAISICVSLFGETDGIFNWFGKTGSAISRHLPWTSTTAQVMKAAGNSDWRYPRLTEADIEKRLTPEMRVAFENAFPLELTRKQMIVICNAESDLNHFDPKNPSQVYRHVNPDGSIDYGLCQINDRTWFDYGKRHGYSEKEWPVVARAQGFDIMTLEGNIGFAAVLYAERGGFQPWEASRARWYAGPNPESVERIELVEILTSDNNQWTESIPYYQVAGKLPTCIAWSSRTPYEWEAFFNGRLIGKGDETNASVPIGYADGFRFRTKPPASGQAKIVFKARPKTPGDPDCDGVQNSSLSQLK